MRVQELQVSQVSMAFVGGGLLHCFHAQRLFIYSPFIIDCTATVFAMERQDLSFNFRVFCVNRFILIFYHLCVVYRCALVNVDA